MNKNILNYSTKINNKKQLIFVGHFDIGEKYNDDMKNLIKEANRTEGDILILVGDINIENKIASYIQNDIEGLKLLYEKRLNSCNSVCTFSQLPKNEKEIYNIIDIDFYENVIIFLKNKYPKLFEKIKNNNEYKDDLTEIVHKHILPKTIQQRIDDYNFSSNKKIIIENEKNLRNRVKRRTSYNKHWSNISDFKSNDKGVFIGDTQIISATNSPLCRGIMFALHEKIWMTNYEKIIYFLENRHERFVKKGLEFFQKFYKELPYLNKDEKEIIFFK